MGKRALWRLVGVFLLAGSAATWMQGAAVAKPKSQPWCELKALVLRTPFDNIRYPHLGKDGSVTFIADDAHNSDSKGINHGIYRYQADGSLVCLVRGGETTVPDQAATLHTIQGLQMGEDGVDFLFNAYDTDKQCGLYHWSKGKLEIVARTGETILPGDTGPIKTVEFGSLCGTRVLYKASSEQFGPALVLHDLATDRNNVLCHGGMKIPGRGDDTFQYIGSTNWVSGDSVVFRAASAENPKESGGKNTEGIYGWFGVKDWSGAGEDLAPERLRTIIDGTARLPKSDGSHGGAFNLFGSAPISGDHIVFEADGDNFTGIFSAKIPDGPVRCVASSQTGFDGPFKGQFVSFGGYPAVNGQNVVFTATVEEDAKKVDDDTDADDSPKSYRGVFVYRLDRGEMFTLADSREPLDGREVASFEIGGHFLVDDHFVVTAHFADKRSPQIYLGTINPEAFKQLNGGETPAK